MKPPICLFAISDKDFKFLHSQTPLSMREQHSHETVPLLTYQDAKGQRHSMNLSAVCVVCPTQNLVGVSVAAAGKSSGVFSPCK